jgi:hypothetical protein
MAIVTKGVWLGVEPSETEVLQADLTALPLERDGDVRTWFNHCRHSQDHPPLLPGVVDQLRKEIQIEIPKD